MYKPPIPILFESISGLNRAPGGPLIGQNQSGIPPVTAEIARDLLRMGRSPTAENILKSTGKMMPDIKLNRPKQQLEYLAHVQGLIVQFTDFPKVRLVFIIFGIIKTESVL